MTDSLHHCRRAGTSITKACVRFGSAVMRRTGSQQRQWNKKTGAGFAA